jgi:hypothetical protein
VTDQINAEVLSIVDEYVEVAVAVGHSKVWGKTVEQQITTVRRNR